MNCSSCGALARADAAWCGQCHQPLSAPSRAVPRQEPLRFVPTYSRWRKTDTSFGPAGRVAWTVAMALVAAMALFSQNPFAIGPLCFLLVPLVLRSVWAKTRVS